MILLHVPEVNCILDTEAIIGKHIKTLVFNVLKIHFLRSCLLYWDNRISVKKNNFIKINLKKKTQKSLIFGYFWSILELWKGPNTITRMISTFCSKKWQKTTKMNKNKHQKHNFFLWLILLLRQTIFYFLFLFFHFFE